MAHLTGVKGRVEAGDASQTAVLGVTSWTVDTEGDAIEVTDYASGGEKDFIAGNTGWSGTFEFEFDTIQDPVGSPPDLVEGKEITVKFYLDDVSGRKVEGDAIVTGVSVTVPQPDIVTFTITFQGTGTLSKDFAGS